MANQFNDLSHINVESYMKANDAFESWDEFLKQWNHYDAYDLECHGEECSDSHLVNLGHMEHQLEALAATIRAKRIEAINKRMGEYDYQI